MDLETFIKNCESVISDLNKILLNVKYQGTAKNRLADGIDAFTYNCPFAEYGDILRNTESYPREYVENRVLLPKEVRFRIEFWKDLISKSKRIEDFDVEIHLKDIVK